MNYNLRRIRIKNGLTQKEISSILNMPYRTYQNYEEGLTSCPRWLEDLIIFRINSLNLYTKEKGIYSIKQIKFISIPIFMKLQVKEAYVFNDYANNSANDNSEIDFLVDSSIPSYLRYELRDKLENEFNKKVILYFVDEYDKNGDFILTIKKKGKQIFKLK